MAHRGTVRRPLVYPRNVLASPSTSAGSKFGLLALPSSPANPLHVCVFKHFGGSSYPQRSVPRDSIPGQQPLPVHALAMR